MNKIGLFLSVALLCAFLSGCTDPNKVVTLEETARAATTLTFFGNKYEPENDRVIEEILTGFMTENPDVRVSYESLKGSAYFDALRKRMASGKGDDVFMVNHDVLLELEKTGQLADLSGLEAIAGYTETMLGQMTQADGSI